MKESPATFLSCDWGSSVFRLRLLSTSPLTVLAEVSSDSGIANVFHQWQKAQGDRLGFYQGVLQKHIGLLEQEAKVSCQHVPLVLSGMATSAMGMMELPYKQMPFLLDGSDLATERLSASNTFPHDVYLVSGVRTETDVMRGEETQLVGSLLDEPITNTEQIVVLPGTHSKHVRTKGNEAVSFQTYMTGEFFSLLSEKSVLANSIERGEDWQEKENHEAFKKGLRDSGQTSLLNSCFRVRIGHLFGEMNKQQNFHYLSGLLIGAELRALLCEPDIPISVVGNGLLVTLYAEAFRLLTPGKTIRTVDGSEAIARGHFKNYNRLKNES